MLSHSDVLRVSAAGDALWIELARPAALNAFDHALQRELCEALKIAGADSCVRAVMVSGQGRAFSAGADLDLDPDGGSLSSRTSEELTERYNPIVRTIREMPKPVVAAVHGAAVGVGCALAIACDQVVAAKSATFMLAFATVGLTVDGGASLLVGARVGFGRALRMALLAERIDADTALEWGLVDEVVSTDEVLDRSSELVLQFASGPTAAFAATKRNVNAALIPGLDAALAREAVAQSGLVDSTDFREGVAAFAGRRAATFTGRG